VAVLHYLLRENMMKRKIAAGFATVGIVVGAFAMPASAGGPKSDPANCVGKVVSFHTTAGLTQGAGGAKALVEAAKASCRDGIPTHG
jgi:hypothetical protein